MTLYEKLESDMKTAMKAGNPVNLSVLRMLIASVRQVQIDKNLKSIEDADVLQILKRHIKQRKESIEQFTNGNRPDLAEKETLELKVLQAYMPAEIGEEELAKIVNEAVIASGAKTKADTGKVMKLVMEKTKGRCDGKVVNQLVMKSLQ